MLSIAVEWLALLFHIREVPYSNLDPVIGYQVLRGFTLSLHNTYGRLLPYPFQSIIHKASYEFDAE
jgi:hypothetical protein